MIKFTTPEVEQDFNNLPDFVKENIFKDFISGHSKYGSDHCLIYSVDCICPPASQDPYPEIYLIHLIDGYDDYISYHLSLDHHRELIKICDKISRHHLQEALLVMDANRDIIKSLRS